MGDLLCTYCSRKTNDSCEPRDAWTFQSCQPICAGRCTSIAASPPVASPSPETKGLEGQAHVCVQTSDTDQGFPSTAMIKIFVIVERGCDVDESALGCSRGQHVCNTFK